MIKMYGCINFHYLQSDLLLVIQFLPLQKIIKNSVTVIIGFICQGLTKFKNNFEAPNL